VLTEPMFLTSVCFVLLFALGVGASTPNLGTISRYRIPLIPFFMAAAAVVDLRLRPRMFQSRTDAGTSVAVDRAALPRTRTRRAQNLLSAQS
jgi:hypothetical protein